MASIPDFSTINSETLDFSRGQPNPTQPASPFNFNITNTPDVGVPPLQLPGLQPGDLSLAGSQAGNVNQSLSIAGGRNPGGFNLGGFNPASTVPASTDSGFFSNAFDRTTTDPTTGAQTTQQGFVSPLLQGLGAVSNIYFGLKGLDLAEDQFDFQKESFNKNFEANKKAFNNAVRRKGAAVANATPNEVLGIGPNATLAEREAAEAAFVKENTASQVL